MLCAEVELFLRLGNAANEGSANLSALKMRFPTAGGGCSIAGMAARHSSAGRVDQMGILAHSGGSAARFFLVADRQHEMLIRQIASTALWVMSPP